VKVLKKHILKEFISALWITTLAFVTLFLMVDIVEKVDDLIEHNVPLWTGFNYFLYKIPFIFCQVSPVAVLLAVLISLGILNKYGEITSIKAGGISLLSVLSPLLVSGFLISALVTQSKGNGSRESKRFPLEGKGSGLKAIRASTTSVR
jgi:lipopolysaccharide export system permease protein